MTGLSHETWLIGSVELVCVLKTGGGGGAGYKQAALDYR
jgi:hypothetical protein